MQTQQIDLAIKVLTILAVVLSGTFLAYRIISVFIAGYKRRNTVEIKKKGTDSSITISKKGSKEDTKRLLDYMEH